MSTIHNAISLQVGAEVFLIDAEDAEKVLAHKWHLFDNGRGHKYAQTNIRTHRGDGRSVQRKLRLHRLVLGIEFGDKSIVDHISGDTRDNRKSNLRVVSPAQNNVNRKRLHGGPYKYPYGWVVRIKRDGESQYLGHFKNHDQAVAVFKQAIGDEYAR